MARCVGKDSSGVLPYDGGKLLQRMQENLDLRRALEYRHKLTATQRQSYDDAVAVLENERTQLKGGKPRRPAPAMLPEDELLLSTMADAYPAAVNQPDLASLTGLSRRTIGVREKWLVSKHLIQRPSGTDSQGPRHNAKRSICNWPPGRRRP